MDTPDPLLINILPREFAQTPNLFGGHVSGLSGIYTNIPVGTSIFRELSPLVGNPVFLENGSDGDLQPLPLNYIPHDGRRAADFGARPRQPAQRSVLRQRRRAARCGRPTPTARSSC